MGVATLRRVKRLVISPVLWSDLPGEGALYPGLSRCLPDIPGFEALGSGRQVRRRRRARLRGREGPASQRWASPEVDEPHHAKQEVEPDADETVKQPEEHPTYERVLEQLHL